MLYFAYGSNLLVERIRLPQRCPNARPVGIACLEGWRLTFEKKGSDGSGKATVRPNGPGECLVHGVLYDLPREERFSLDRAEGPGYSGRAVEVKIAGGRQRAWLYVAVEGHLDPGVRPFRWYRDLVHAGALQHALPASYASAIAAVPAQSDPVHERATRMQRVLESAGYPAR